MPWPLIVAAVLGAVGSISGGRQQDKVAKHNAAVSEQNALFADRKAEFEADRHREGIRRVLSSQRAAIGKSGVDVSGSAALALEETARAGELDALAIRYGGDIESARARSEAQVERAVGESAKTAGAIRGGTTLLTTGSKFFGSK